MSIVIVTGSAGLIGSEASRHFAKKGLTVVGIDNDMRKEFFGDEASTLWQRQQLKNELGKNYRHIDGDIRDADLMNSLFNEFGKDIKLIVHTAAQPSHDWAARDPHKDFTVNANGTLNLLEATRQNAPDAVFIFTSTNKVYGDTQSMSIDSCMHSLFGASKVAADIMVQEYGKYFDMKTAAFRGGCLTGPNHSGTQLHGFLAYLMKCTMTGTPYKVFGYQGKQVRDNIHSYDLIQAFDHFFTEPRCGEVYNIGGSRFSHCSMLEGIKMCEEISGRELQYSYEEDNRMGDHIWYVSDVSKFQNHYPKWSLTKDVRTILSEIYEFNTERWQEPVSQ